MQNPLEIKSTIMDFKIIKSQKLKRVSTEQNTCDYSFFVFCAIFRIFLMERDFFHVHHFIFVHKRIQIIFGLFFCVEHTFICLVIDMKSCH